MGQPEHYSLDLPARCLHLLKELQPCASKIFMPGQDEGLGPLVATFALTMAMPIITLPCERIFKPNKQGFQYADDRELNDGLAESVKTQMSLSKFSKASFFRHQVWSFVQVEKAGLFNLSRGIPDTVAKELSKEKALDSAANMPVSQWMSCLRNALAHGGIAYLDTNGMPTYGQPVRMYVFVSGRYNRDLNPPELTGLNVLRISHINFVQFLHDWVEWLQQSGIDLEAAA